MDYIERYWRDATPQDAIKEPPMLARFRHEVSDDWEYDYLVGWDRTDDDKWRGNMNSSSICQVYDAPAPKYVPFTWDDREQLRGRWVVGSDGDEHCIIRLELYLEVFLINGNPAEDALEEWKFADTREPVGRRVE